jgi:hypothetical protein
MKRDGPRPSRLHNAVFALLYAQQPPSGVVTGVEGQAQLTRPPLTPPASLRVKDGVIIRDVIDTREKSLGAFCSGEKR